MPLRKPEKTLGELTISEFKDIILEPALSVLHERMDELENSLASVISAPKDLICFDEACNLLNFSASELQQKIHSQKVPYIFDGKEIVFSKRLLSKWKQNV